MRMTRRHLEFVWLGCVLAALQLPGLAAATEPLPTLEEAIASDRDLWGEAALARPGGPTYEFFAGLLPPLRYVDAPFRHYPISLSAPGAAVKARLVSNGSAVNALARQPNWRGETGTPVTFRVGRARELFGDDLRRLEGPVYDKGYLPIVQLRYRHGDEAYAQEVFAAVDADLAAHGAVLVRFTLAEGAAGKVEAQFEGAAPLKAAGRAVGNDGGKVLASFDARWTFNPARNTLSATLAAGESATLALFTRPADAPLPLADDVYDRHRNAAADVWGTLIARGPRIDVPEPLVNDAWRSLVIGSFALLTGDEMRYSAGNQYAKLYIGEGGDAVRALLLLGYAGEARRMIPPLFDYTRKGLEFHQAGFKLQMLAHYYLLTRDAEFLRAQRPRWQKEVDVILAGREKDSGLLPREKYCGDIDTRVYSLNSNANTWRALRDMAVVLHDLGGGDEEQGARLEATAAEFRAAILAAVGKSIRRDVDPPFVPIALSGEEPPYERVVGSRMGSYWNIMSCYVLGSGVFPPDAEPVDAILAYARRRGGRFMGMNRARPEPSWWVSTDNVNDLYGMRDALALLRRDEPDLALVGFYGKLAHGLTRDTFIGCEGSGIRPEDEFGRQMYLPPNSASNASFLQQLRHLLVQDWDLDDDGRPETLRLLFATPRDWLRDGAEIHVERAPTAFGELSLHVRSKLAAGEVLAELSLPERAPAQKTLLRVRLPAGWRADGAEADGRALARVGDETFDLSGLAGQVAVRVVVKRALAE
jgi:hypothetical protein